MLGEALMNPAGEKAHDWQVLKKHPLLFAIEPGRGGHRRRVFVSQ
jgi:hypothetical protein